MQFLIILAALCAVASARYHRPVTKVLTIANGGHTGTWRSTQFCQAGSYVTEFTLKVQADRGPALDDTAVNGIRLGCSYEYNLQPAGTIMSYESEWGKWGERKFCRQGGANKMFITGFRLKVEPYQGSLGDDTAANNIIFRCTPMYGNENHDIEGKGERWGKYGAMSERCPSGSAVCGIQVKSEKPQGMFGDDTALNDVKFYCCNQ